MPEFLFELGCEELPAGSLQRAAHELKSAIEGRLAQAGVGFRGREPLFTPRRLIVGFSEVDEVQPEQTTTQRGPALKAAYDADGKPTPALLGFCRGQGVHPETVSQEGDYVWARKTTPGRPTIEVLREVLPEVVAEVPFPKTMRWAGGTLRFARPIRWILASFGEKIVDFEIEGVRSGLMSRGHRFRTPQDFQATTWDALTTGLRERFVEPSFEVRRARIAEQVAQFTGEDGLVADLVSENANLTEWPEALSGEFRPEFLKLPAPVLQTVMAKHERFFPVKGSDGNVTNRFVSVRNGGEEAFVREGNAWVLNARFNDARFFYEEDLKHTLAEFLERTRSMAFQEKLGTVRQRADRLAVLAREVALWSNASEEECGLAYEAGLYAKADLTTGLVSELDELQGVIGGEYARREGFADPVCWAIASQYDPSKNPVPECEGGRTAVRLLIADQLDKIVGFMGVGFAPTGSSDPYGLRRSVTQLIEAVWSWPTPLPSLLTLFEVAYKGYQAQGFGLDHAMAMATAQDVLDGRYRALLDGRHDHVAASVLPGEDLLHPRGVRHRLEAVKALAGDTAFVQCATRPANIVSAAMKKEVSFDAAVVSGPSLQSEEAEDLWRAWSRQAPLAERAVQDESTPGLVQALRPLVEPVNRFFDTTMVMVDDPAVRSARLKLLSDCDRVFRLAGDWTKVVIEG